MKKKFSKLTLKVVQISSLDTVKGGAREVTHPTEHTSCPGYSACGDKAPVNLTAG